MVRKALVLAGLLATGPAAAQSRVDRVPEPTPKPELPISPLPSDEVNSAPEQRQPSPELIAPEPEPPTRLVPGAPDSDSLTGHILPYAVAGYSFGFGHIDNVNATRDRLDPGMVFGLGLGYGISRSVEIGLDGSYASLSGGNTCPDCTGRLIDARLFLAYHLVQGTRFDPWVRFGAGLTNLRLSDAGNNTDYTGVTLANVTFGGDWFATRHFGVGPVLSFGLSTYFKTPATHSAALSERLTLGLRLTFDVAGR